MKVAEEPPPSSSTSNSTSVDKGKSLILNGAARKTSSPLLIQPVVDVVPQLSAPRSVQDPVQEKPRPAVRLTRSSSHLSVTSDETPEQRVVSWFCV